MRFGLSILAATFGQTLKLSGTKNNVFGIQTGVAISFFVKRKEAAKAAHIFYARRPEMETAEDKLSFLSTARLSALDMAP